MLGTALNTAGILLGGIAGLVATGEMPPRRQLFLKVLIGVALVWFGLRIAFTGLLAADWRYFGKLFLILIIAMVLGRAVGRLAKIQDALNSIGQYAKQKLASAAEKPFDGFVAVGLLLTAAPLGLVGAIEDGIGNRYHSWLSFQPLLIKGAIDGLGAFSFARMFGWPVLLSAIPVAAFQMIIAFAARGAEPWLSAHQLTDAVHVVCGFLVVYVSLIVFEVKKVELGDYLPAIVVAPALLWVFR